MKKLGRPSKGVKSLSITLPENLIEKLAKAGKRTLRDRSNLIAEAVKNYFEKGMGSIAKADPELWSAIEGESEEASISTFELIRKILWGYFTEFKVVLNFEDNPELLEMIEIEALRNNKTVDRYIIGEILLYLKGFLVCCPECNREAFDMRTITVGGTVEIHCMNPRCGHTWEWSNE